MKVPHLTKNIYFLGNTQKSPENPQIPDISLTGVKIPKNVLFGDKIPMVGSPAYDGGSFIFLIRGNICLFDQVSLNSGITTRT